MRLQKEYQRLGKEPLPDVVAEPKCGAPTRAGCAAPRRACPARHRGQLAPTPLGVPTTRRFSLVNRGYANERVSHRLPSDTNKIDLRVEYPEGTQIGVAQPTLPVDVTFVSSTPMSFTAAIDFLDEEGNRFCAPVSGVADNSALTLPPLLLDCAQAPRCARMGWWTAAS